MSVASLSDGGLAPVTAPPRARRVASLLPSLTDILVEAGAESCLVAISHECTVLPPSPRAGGVAGAPPPRVVTAPSFDAASVRNAAEISAVDAAVRAAAGATPTATAVDLLRLRLCSFYHVDVAALVAAAPDVVLTHIAPAGTPGADLFGDDAAAADPVAILVAALSSLLPPGRPPVRIVSVAAESVADAITAAVTVTSAAGVPTSGAALLTAFPLRLARCVRDVPRMSASRPTVAVVQWADPLYCAGGWVPEAVAAAGGTDGVCVPGGPSVATTWAGLAAAGVDVVVMAACAMPLAANVRLGRAALTGGGAAPDATTAAAAAAAAADLARRGVAVYAVDATTAFSRLSPGCIVTTVGVLGGVLRDVAAGMEGSGAGPGWARLTPPRLVGTGGWGAPRGWGVAAPTAASWSTERVLVGASR
ncbi:hypothetical protein MMPV_001381 [Pyropia vietnamensis]